MKMPGCVCQESENVPILNDISKGHNTVVIWVKKNQNELMVEIYSKRLVRAIGKVLCMTFS